MESERILQGFSLFFFVQTFWVGSVKTTSHVSFFCAYNIRSLLLRKFLKNSLAHLIHSKAKRDADIMKVMAHIWNAVRSQRRLKL